MMRWWLALLWIYGWTVFYRAKLMTHVPKFCQDVTHCRRPHRLVFVAPPNKPFRAVLKHVGV